LIKGVEFARRINDPVHGTILLSDAEIAVVGTKAFQRLHHVYQLGLTHLVFPGANYTRFAHSLGACHISGRLLDAVSTNAPGHLSPEEIQTYRLAALLHDIGHYPFSHAMEHAIGRHYPAQRFLAGHGGKTTGEKFKDLSIDDEPPSYDHELLGKRIISYDIEIADALTKHGFAPAQIIGAFAASKPGSLIHLLSSDLDCDRLDYLMRTAHHAGMPYGAVDIDYIVSQATVDDKGIFCFRQQGLKAADHLLISRFFDYQQVPFHKTVVGLELLLEQVLSGMFSLGLIDCSAAQMLKRIESGDWSTFDDQHMHRLFRDFVQDGKRSAAHPDLALKTRSLLHRNPPRLVASFERLARRDDASGKIVRKTILERFENNVQKWSAETGIPEAQWLSWDTSFELTKVGGSYSLSSLRARSPDDDAERAVRLLQSRSSRGRSQSKTIMEFEQALMMPLSDQVYHSVRIYVLLDPDDADAKQRRAKAIELLAEAYSDIPYLIT